MSGAGPALWAALSALAAGGGEPGAVTLELTPLQVEPINLPDLPPIDGVETLTATRARHHLPLERALEIYRDKHMIVFEDDARSMEAPGTTRPFYVARGKRLIHECDVRRAASAPLSPTLLEFCEGNNWEWAWSAFPLGVLFAGLGAEELATEGVTLTFAFGTAVALSSAMIAILFNRDAVDVEDGRFASTREDIEAIVARSNAGLRKVLDLTEAEVRVAGLPR